MYVCTHTCPHARMYVSTYACLYACVCLRVLSFAVLLTVMIFQAFAGSTIFSATVDEPGASIMIFVGGYRIVSNSPFVAIARFI